MEGSRDWVIDPCGGVIKEVLLHHHPSQRPDTLHDSLAYPP